MNRFESWLELNYGLKLEDVEPTEARGYWRKKVSCDPSMCRSPLHGFMFNEGPIRHTIYYTDAPRISGRFSPKFKTWDGARNTNEVSDGQ